MSIIAGIRDMTNGEYHAQPSLSSSGARKLLPPYCPAIFKWEQDHPKFTDTFDFGHAAHKMVLGDESTKLVQVDAADWRTKAAKDARDEARAAGAVPVLTADYEVVTAMAAAIKAHPIASALLRPGAGEPEKSLLWQDDDSGVWRRARLDWLPHPVKGRRLIVPDYKTCRSANPETFARSAADYGYHQQAAWYLDGIRALKLGEDPAFVFIAQEKVAPYLVTVIELNETAMTIGRNLNRWAINTFKQCTETNTWPGYSEGIELVSLPAYYEKRHDEDPSQEAA